MKRSATLTRQERFWAQLGHSERVLTQRFVNDLQEAPEQVVVFTARKAACIGDALRLTSAWTPHNEVCSSEALGFDTSWLVGKSVVLVDDVLGTGQTADGLLTRLEMVGCSSIRFLAIASRPEWPSSLDALRQRHPRVAIDPIPQLDGTNQALSEDLVRAIGAVPRPYNLDWPLLTGWVTSPRELDSVIVETGWSSRTTTSALHAHLGVNTIVLEPRAKQIGRYLRKVDAPQSTVGLLKIRLYIEPRPSGGLHVSVMPILAFDRLHLEDLPGLLSSVGLPASLWRRGSETAAVRIAQYFASLQFGRDFTSLQPFADRRISLGESQWQLRLGLTPAVQSYQSAPVQSSRVEGARQGAPEHVRSKPRTRAQASDAAKDMQFARFILTRSLWDRSRVGERLQARSAVRGGNAEAMGDFLNMIWPQPGFTVGELIERLKAAGVAVQSSAGLASAYLDEAIDTGITVPALRVQEDCVERIFRAGETIAFGLREQRLFRVLLEEVLRRSPEMVIGRILLEKILVLAVRYAVEQNALVLAPPVPTPGAVMTIAYSRYGSIATLDGRAAELPIASEDTHTLGRELDDLDVIAWVPRKPGSRQHKVALGGAQLEPAARQHEMAFRRLGSVVAKLLSGGIVSNPDFDMFVVLCNGNQIPLALGAEVDQVRRGLPRIVAALRHGLSGDYLARQLGNERPWVLSLQSALEKIAARSDDVVNRVAEAASTHLDADALLTWDEVRALVVVPPTAPDLLRLIRRLECWLLQVAVIVQEARAHHRPTKRGDGIDRRNAADLAGKLGIAEEMPKQFEPTAITAELHRLERDADSLLEEVSASHDETTLQQPPERYTQALLLVAALPLDAKAREDIAAGLQLLLSHQRSAVQPIPPVILHEQIAGFAILNGHPYEVAEQLYPFLMRDFAKYEPTIMVVTALGDTRRLLRRTYNSHWYGAGFKLLCEDLVRLAAGQRGQLLIVEDVSGGVEV